MGTVAAVPIALLSVYDKAGIGDLAEALHRLGWRICRAAGPPRRSPSGRAGHRRRRTDRRSGDPRPPGGHAPPEGPRRAARRPDQARAPGRHGRPTASSRSSWSSSTSTRSRPSPGHRADRHRWAGDGAGRGQEPRPRRRRRRPGRLRRSCSTRSEEHGEVTRRDPAPARPRRVRPHRRVRRRDRRRGSTTSEPDPSRCRATLHLSRSNGPSRCATARTRTSRAPATGSRARTSWWDTTVQHGGKELSYLNLYDTEAAWRLVNASTSRRA